MTYRSSEYTDPNHHDWPGATEQLLEYADPDHFALTQHEFQTASFTDRRDVMLDVADALSTGYLQAPPGKFDTFITDARQLAQEYDDIANYRPEAPPRRPSDDPENENRRSMDLLHALQVHNFGN